MAQELALAALQSEVNEEQKAQQGPIERTYVPESHFDVTFSDPGQLGLSIVRVATGWTIVSRAIPGTQAAR